MAQNNSIDNKTSQLTVDPGASGDSFITFSITGTPEFTIGVDDTDGDAFKIAQGGVLGTNDTFIMTPDGERTLPLNPAFNVYLASDDVNVTGNGTVYTLGTNTAFTEVFDQSNDVTLNPVTFTAPVTGKYLLSLDGTLTDVGISTLFDIRIVTSNRTYFFINAYVMTGDSGINMGMICDMDASDTAQCQIRASGAGADTVDVSGSATVVTAFYGTLIA